MPIGNIGTRMVNNYATIDQTLRARSNQEMKEEDWTRDKPIRDVKRTVAQDMLLTRDADVVTSGGKYNYALELKRRNDTERQNKWMLDQAKAYKLAGDQANLNVAGADAAMIRYSTDPSNENLSEIARHTSGSGQAREGFYQVGPYPMRRVHVANMTPGQRQEMDRIQQNRDARVQGGVYKEETFMDGVKRFVNTVSNEVFDQDVWLEDDKGKLYTPEHIKAFTGQANRSKSQYQSTQKQPSVPKKIVKKPQPQQTPSVEKETKITSPKVPEVKPMSEKSHDELAIEYGDYLEKDKTFLKRSNETITKLKKSPPGSAGATLADEIGTQGPKVDEFIINAVEKYPNELKRMSSEEFIKFYNSRHIKAETNKDTITNTDGTTTSKKELSSNLQEELTAYINMKETSANLPKGAQKANKDQQDFMIRASTDGAIDKAIAEGVTTFNELKDWTLKKGRFKQKTGQQLVKEDEKGLRKHMIAQAYSPNSEGKEHFNIDKFSKMKPSETVLAQQTIGKNSDFKEDIKLLKGVKGWYSNRKKILEFMDNRIEYAEPNKMMDIIGDKWLSSDFDEGSKKGAEVYGALVSLMGKTVADEVKLMSGTAASDKERAGILRYMFGDSGTSRSYAEGAMEGYSIATYNKLKPAAIVAFGKGGYDIARELSVLHEQYKDDNISKKSKKKESLLERAKRILKTRQGGK